MADNPCSRVTPEELTQAAVDNQGGYRSGISTCIQCACAWETLSEMEHMGGKVRDTEFRGAAFRDERTKLLFAYDYTNRFVMRAWGHNFKPLLREECRRLGVRVMDRTAVTALLTEGGRPGGRVIGATYQANAALADENEFFNRIDPDQPVAERFMTVWSSA